MTMIEPLITELDQESVATRRLMERVPADKLGWKPHPKARSLGELAAHIAMVPRVLSGFLQHPSYEAGGTPEHMPASTEELLQLFDDSLAAAKANLAKFSDDELNATWSLTRGGVPIFELPRAGVIRRVILNHLYHHRGQLTTYLRTLDVPLPSVYGPTADENPFM
jgi:uncharacterized damage-inducible protein DinB